MRQARSSQFISRQAVIDHVWTVSPTLILNFRCGYNRFIRSDDTNPANWGFDLTTLGSRRRTPT